MKYYNDSMAKCDDVVKGDAVVKGVILWLRVNL